MILTFARRAPGRLLALATIVAVLASCGDGGDATAGARVRVVASFYPLEEAARRVGGDRVEVTNLTAGGGEPHDLELAAGDLAAIHEADLLLYLGDGFQPSVERAAAERNGPSLDLLEGADLIEGKADEHAEEDGHAEEEGHAEHAEDPHVWLDPVRFAAIADRIAAALGAADAGGAERYRANAAAYREDLEALDQEHVEALRECDRRTFVVSHAAFGYLAARYDLTQEAIAGLSPESEPTPGRLAELRELVRETGVEVIFTERLASPRVAQTLAREAGVRVEVLDPIEGLTAEQARANASYASIMRANLAKLVDALGCRG